MHPTHDPVIQALLERMNECLHDSTVKITCTDDIIYLRRHFSSDKKRYGTLCQYGELALVIAYMRGWLDGRNEELQ